MFRSSCPHPCRRQRAVGRGQKRNRVEGGGAPYYGGTCGASRASARAAPSRSQAGKYPARCLWSATRDRLRTGQAGRGDSPLSQSGAIVGTPSYMAPEQAAAKRGLTVAVDVYSLGAILYELLTGRPPFQAGTPLDTLFQATEKEPERPSSVCASVDPDLETICLKCLEKEPTRRYGNAEALADDLQRWLRGEPVRARRTGPWLRALKWARRRPTLAGVAVLVVLTVLLGFVGALLQLRQTQEQRDKAGGGSRQTRSSAAATTRPKIPIHQPSEPRAFRVAWRGGGPC
jgi:hypothetical protein